jgi:hypothetical protein
MHETKHSHFYTVVLEFRICGAFPPYPLYAFYHYFLVLNEENTLMAFSYYFIADYGGWDRPSLFQEIWFTLLNYLVHLIYCDTTFFKFFVSYSQLICSSGRSVRFLFLYLLLSNIIFISIIILSLFILIVTLIINLVAIIIIIIIIIIIYLYNKPTNTRL